MHTPTGSKNLHIVPRTADNKEWKWDKQVLINEHADVFAGGNVIANGGILKIGQWYLQDVGNDLRIHKGDPNTRWWTFGGNGGFYSEKRGKEL